MKMSRIAIVGSGGSGKSTLARRLGALLGINVIHLDSLFWQPGWVATETGAWRGIQEDLVKGDSWIIDGNYSDTMDVRLEAADTVIFLDFPRSVCLWRAVRRWFQYTGRSRPDVGPGCPEKLDWEFIRWIWTFPAAKRPALLAKIDRYAQGRWVVRLRTPAEVGRFLAEVERGREV